MHHQTGSIKTMMYIIHQSNCSFAKQEKGIYLLSFWEFQKFLQATDIVTNNKSCKKVDVAVVIYTVPLSQDFLWGSPLSAVKIQL